MLEKKINCEKCGESYPPGWPHTCSTEACSNKKLLNKCFDKVVDLDSKKPHFVIDGLGGNQHVVPLQFFKDVSLGKISITELEEYELLMPTIINEWLLFKEVK